MTIHLLWVWVLCHNQSQSVVANLPFEAHRGDNSYGEMAERMVHLATRQPGFLGVESVRTPDGFGITASYWSSTEALAVTNANRWATYQLTVNS